MEKSIRKRVTVFCGSATPRSPRIVEEAQRLGRLFGELGLGLVYGGASSGVMGAVASAALAAGAEVIGVLPRKLSDREIAHPDLAALELVETMAERKERMMSLADAFVALPGGFGTLDELFEVLTMRQVGYFERPTYVVDLDGFYAGLTTFVERAADEGLIRAEHRHLFVTIADVESLRPHLIHLAGY